MADVRPIQEAANAYVDISARLREITQLQDTQLDQMRAMNVENTILQKIRASHLTNDQRLLSLQTSIEAKTNRILALHERIQQLRVIGTTTAMANAQALEAQMIRMRNQISEANEEYRKLHRSIAVSAAILSLVNKIGLKEMLETTKEISEAWSVHPIMGIGKVLEYAVGVFNKFDVAAANFRMNVGFTREYTKSIDQYVRDIAFNFANIGVDAKIVYDAIYAISSGLFSSVSATKKMATDVAMMATSLGVSASTFVEFAKSMGIASRATAESQLNMGMFAAKLSQAAGIPLKEVMEDINIATKSSYQFISRSGLSLIKAAVEAKRMGTTLQDVAKSADSLIRFPASVKAEMEASVLVGKAINLQHARELAYRRDLKGLNAEILRLMKEANFEQLDPFQQEAVAAAFGKSAGELAQMAQAERERLRWETSTDPIVRRQLSAYKEMMSATESIAKTNAEDMRTQLRIKSNQATIVAITQSWNAILQRIGESILPAVEMTLRGILWVVNGIHRFITGFNDIGEMLGLPKTFKFLSGIVVLTGLLVSSRYLGRLFGWATGGAAGTIGNLLGGVARGVSSFGGTNVLRGALGITAVGAALWVFGKSISVFAGTDWKAVFVGIGALSVLSLVAGIMGHFAPMILLGALSIGALGLAMLPFAGAAWIMSKACQNLVNVPLLKIAAGLGALGMVAPLIIAAGTGLGLATPGFVAFSLAMRLMAGPAERLGQAMMNLGLGLKMTVQSMALLQTLSFTGTILQVRNLASAITDLSQSINAMPDIKIEKLKTFIIPSTPTVAEGAKKGESMVDVLVAIKDGIDGLRNDMKNGVLTANVYLDSQKLDSGMARRLAYTGQLTS